MPSLYLVRHAGTSAKGRHAFPSSSGASADEDGDPGLDETGTVAALTLREHLPVVPHVWASHADRTAQTATLLARPPDRLTGLLAESDMGEWAGRTITHVHAEDSNGVARWLRDPDHSPPGGESYATVRGRAATLLGQVADLDEPVLAVTHGGFIRATVGLVLGVGRASTTRIAIPKASVTVIFVGGAEESSWRLATLAWMPRINDG